jgi:hypothetical protein
VIITSAPGSVAKKSMCANPCFRWKRSTRNFWRRKTLPFHSVTSRYEQFTLGHFFLPIFKWTSQMW